MERLLVIVPTRGRPERFEEFLNAWAATTAGTARLLACLDDGDHSAFDYPDIPEEIGEYTIGPRNGFAPRLNAEALACDAWAIASFGDDHLPRTVGWDARMLEALADLGSGIVYPNDLLQGEALPTAPAITMDIVRELGWVGGPGLKHMWIDNLLLSIGLRLGRIRYLPDVIVEHMHPVAEKAEYDATYNSAIGAAYVEDETAFRTYYDSAQMAADLERVRDKVLR
jgi:hypothetical protein